MSRPPAAPPREGFGRRWPGAGELECEFVCSPRQLERSERDEGSPLRYRVRFLSKLGQRGERPVLERRIVEGDVGLSI